MPAKIWAGLPGEYTNDKEWQECPASEATLCLLGKAWFKKGHDEVEWHCSRNGWSLTTENIAEFGGKFYREVPQPKILEKNGWLFKEVNGSLVCKRSHMDHMNDPWFVVDDLHDDALAQLLIESGAFEVKP
jgi:hypothetical protein